MNIQRADSNIPALITLDSRDATICEVNPSAINLLQLDRTALIGTSFCDLIDFSAVTPQENELQALKNVWIRQLQTPNQVATDIRLLSTHEEQIELSITITPMSGRAHYPLVILSPKAESEAEAELQQEIERLQLLTDATLDAIMTVDAWGNITFWNKGAERIYGYAAEEVLGRNVTMLLPEEYRQAHQEMIEQTVRELTTNPTAQTVLDGGIVEMPAQHKDGHIFPLEVSNSLIVSAQYAFSTSVSRDISRRKEAEHQLAALNQELEERVHTRTEELECANQELRRLAYELGQVESCERQELGQIIHDTLGQTLAIARMQLAEFLPATPSLSRVNETLDTALTQTRNLSQQLYPPGLQVNGLLPTLEWVAEYVKTEYGLNLTLELEDAAEPTSEELRIFFYRTIRELLMNIVKHAGVKQATVKLQQEEGLLKLTVSDQGRGIFQDSAQALSQQSFGLLSIQQQTLHLRGNFLLNSEPNKGTTVTISLKP